MPITINDCAECGSKAEADEIRFEDGIRHEINCLNRDCNNSQWDYGYEWVVKDWNEANKEASSSEN